MLDLIWWQWIIIIVVVGFAMACAFSAWCSCVLGGRADAAKRDAILRRWEEGR